MKKTIILALVVVLTILLALLAFSFMKDAPKLSDNAKGVWLERCENNSVCLAGVEKNYLHCVNSLSFEKPTDNSHMAEYINLTKIEIEGCLSEKIGNDFPVFE